jgi:hypothetical protein
MTTSMDAERPAKKRLTVLRLHPVRSARSSLVLISLAIFRDYKHAILLVVLAGANLVGANFMRLRTA